jgi:non-ribosomal peptide synthetase component F
MTAPEEWSFPAVADVVAAVPDREMVVCGPVRRTFAEVADRSRSLATFLAAHGVGLHAERDELAQSPVVRAQHLLEIRSSRRAALDHSPLGILGEC